MKSLNNIALGVLALAVAILYFLHFSTPAAAPASANEATASMVNASNGKEPRVVYVNTDSLLNSFTYYKNLKADAEKKRERFMKEMEQKKMAFQKEIMEYQQTGAGMTDLQRQSKEKALMEKEQQLAQYEQSQSDAILKAEEKATENLYKKMTSYLAEYCKDKPYKVVMAMSKGSSILYANDSLDITKDVLKGLNEIK